MLDVSIFYKRGYFIESRYCPFPTNQSTTWSMTWMMRIDTMTLYHPSPQDWSCMQHWKQTDRIENNFQCIITWPYKLYYQHTDCRIQGMSYVHCSLKNCKFIVIFIYAVYVSMQACRIWYQYIFNILENQNQTSIRFICLWWKSWFINDVSNLGTGLLDWEHFWNYYGIKVHYYYI